MLLTNVRIILIKLAFGENNPSWNFRIVGDNQIYSQAGGKEGTTNYAGLVVRSLRWPGATCVYKVHIIFLIQLEQRICQYLHR